MIYSPVNRLGCFREIWLVDFEFRQPDTVLVEAHVETIEGIVVKTQEYLTKASKIALRGFTLRSDANIVRYPDRYMDDRGVEMWNEVMRILDEIEVENV